MSSNMFYKVKVYEHPVGKDKRQVAENWCYSYEAAHKWAKEYMRWNTTMTYEIFNEPAEGDDEGTRS